MDIIDWMVNVGMVARNEVYTGPVIATHEPPGPAEMLYTPPMTLWVVRKEKSL